jgi:hypothetical protein
MTSSSSTDQVSAEEAADHRDLLEPLQELRRKNGKAEVEGKAVEARPLTAPTKATRAADASIAR